MPTAITGRQYSKLPLADVHFPNPPDLTNYTKSENTSKVRIPLSLIQERLKELTEGGKNIVLLTLLLLLINIERLPVSFALLRNLLLSGTLANTFTQTTNTCNTGKHVHTTPDQDNDTMSTLTVASDVITAQVGASRTEHTTSPSLQMNPIGLNFTIEINPSSTSGYYQCVYWNFSDP